MERIYKSEQKTTEVESEQKTTEVEIEIEFEEEEEELEFIVPWEDEEMEDSSSGNTGLYSKTFGGFVAIAALLIVPLVTLPGMVILVLFAEIYLIDWTYAKVNQIRKAKSTLPTGLRGGQDCADETERKNPRTDPKGQFVK